MDCADSEEGIQLHHQYGVETESLVPQQTYVPWVTFNHVSIFCQNIFYNCSHHFYTFMKQKILMPISIEIYRNILKMTHLKTANSIYSTAFVEITYKEFQNVIDKRRNEMFVLIIGEFADNQFCKY